MAVVFEWTEMKLYKLEEMVMFFSITWPRFWDFVEVELIDMKATVTYRVPTYLNGKSIW